jgi:trimethylamine--corrinoid protein Co-methyltransferase
MRPRLQLLDQPLLDRVLGEAFALLEQPGIRLTAPAAIELLTAGGCRVKDGIAQIPEPVARRALASAPREFFLYSRSGEPVVHYGGDHVHFDPGSSCLNVLDPETLQPRLAQTADLVRLVQVAEMLPAYAAQSTAVVCNDVPREIGDLYRLFVVLKHSGKPVVTGAFSAQGLAPMLELLALDSGGPDRLRERPRAVFDVCPSPPLNWSDFASQNLIDLAKAGVPAEIVSVPMAGATAPVTLAGAVVQHAAECIGGVTLHQLAAPGAPVVWGGAPTIFDMRTGAAPMGAIETSMLNAACSQVGKALSLPTHGYLVASDSKLVDAQAGMESAVSAVLGALAGINMISGAGMLELLATHSVEKLLLDAEAIGSACRLIQGIEARTESLALAMFSEAGPRGDFLKLKQTRELFRLEQHFPSEVVDRGDILPDGAPRPDAFQRARQRVESLLTSYQPPALATERAREMETLIQRAMAPFGSAAIPNV